MQPLSIHKGVLTVQDMTDRSAEAKPLRRRAAMLLGQWAVKLPATERPAAYRSLIAVMTEEDAAVQLAAVSAPSRIASKPAVNLGLTCNWADVQCSLQLAHRASVPVTALRSPICTAPVGIPERKWLGKVAAGSSLQVSRYLDL